MSSTHQGLLVPADTAVHRLAPQCKVAATVLFVLALVCTPARAYLPYLWYLALLAAIAGLARLAPLLMARRLLVEVPFVLFVVTLPLLGGPPRLAVLGIALSVPGLHAAASVTLKATFGLLATGILVATTPASEIITGLERLRVPRVFTAVASFMVRYLDVLSAELARMRIAARCRGANPRWIWQVRDVTAGLGALVVRTFERGERVYLAMASRGYTGSVPARLTGTAAPPVEWAGALAVPALAAVGLVLA